MWNLNGYKMGKQKFKNAKNNKNQGKNFNGKKKNYSKKPNKFLRVQRHIERNKESEEILKRQQLGEWMTYDDLNS